MGIPLQVFGPETHMTAIVAMGLGKTKTPGGSKFADPHTTANFLLLDSQDNKVSNKILYSTM